MAPTCSSSACTSSLLRVKVVWLHEAIGVKLKGDSAGQSRLHCMYRPSTSRKGRPLCPTFELTVTQ